MSAAAAAASSSSSFLPPNKPYPAPVLSRAAPARSGGQRRRRATEPKPDPAARGDVEAVREDPHQLLATLIQVLHPRGLHHAPLHLDSRGFHPAETLASNSNGAPGHPPVSRSTGSKLVSVLQPSDNDHGSSSQV